MLKEGERALEAGECMVIYPEGTAARDPAGWPMMARRAAGDEATPTA